MEVLIVGSNGLVGRHAAAYFKATEVPVMCASHQPGADLRMDLRDPIDEAVHRLPDGITHALICSGITSIDACSQHPEQTRQFNVTQAIVLLQALLQRGIQPIFCSSDLVFRGDRGNYAEEDAREPSTEYGRQKQAVEDFLFTRKEPWLILRLSKLYSLEPDDSSPIDRMLTALRAGSAIRCAEDQTICPTWAGDIPRALHLLMRRGARGAYHVAAPERYTRYTLGLRIAEALGTEHLVQRCSLRDLALREPRPSNNSLDVDKLLAETGMRCAALEAMLPEIMARRAARHPYAVASAGVPG